MSGWIKLHRKLLDWEWYSKPVVKSIFIHSLLRANFKDGKWRGHDVKRGSYISSVDKLIDELGHSRQEIRTALKHLKSTSELTTKSGSQHTVFTVVNYESYQDTTNDLTNEQPTANQRATTNKNVKNKKNEKNKPVSDSRFDEFYDLYDKKVGGKKVKVKFDSLSKKAIDKIFEVVEDYVLSTPNKQYRKAPLVWLNGEHWNDEIERPLALDNYDYVIELFNDSMACHGEVPQAVMMDKQRIENIEFLFANTDLNSDSLENYFNHCSISESFTWFRERNQFDLTWYLSTDAYKRAKERR